MKTLLDCVPCIMRQAVESPRRLTDDEEVLERIVRETAGLVAGFDLSATPPEMGGALNEIIARAVGMDDPYLEEKRRLNDLALEALPDLERLIDGAPDPFAAAVRIAIAGNVMDAGSPGGRTDGAVVDLFAEALERPLRGGGDEAVSRLSEAVGRAREILYLADNSGEIAVDRLLLERLPRGRVTVVVRGGPAINDALVADAEQVGIGELAEVIDNGARLPGTALSRCSESFLERLARADVVISKGQGNYETLSDEEGPFFFLLMAKCRPVASRLGCEVGDLVVAEGRAP